MSESVRIGAGRPIVLLHGCGGSFASTFEAPGWLDAITAAGRQAIKIHLPGHGVIPASHDPQYYADLAGLLIDKLPPSSFDAVGFSLGAKILLELALRIPERVSRLVLGGVGDNVFAPESVAAAAALALESGVTSDTPPPVLAFMQTWEPARNDALAVAAVLRRPANPCFTPARLAAVTQPVLIVNGTEDPVARNAALLMASLPRVSLRQVPTTGHFDLPRQPEFIHSAIEFLKEPHA